MNLIITIILALLLTPVAADCRMNVGVLGGGVSAAAGPTCTTKGDLVASYTTNEGSENILDNNARGEKFNVASNANLYSIDFFMVTVGGNVTITARYGSSADLTTYLDSTTKAITTADNGTWVELLFKDTTNVMNGDYYLGLLGDGAAAVTWGRGYPAAAAGLSVAASAGWTMGAVNTSISYLIRVYKCAD